MTSSFFAPLRLACVLLLATACHHTNDGGEADGDVASITVTPAVATLTISGTTPVTQAYTAQAKFTDGHVSDVSARVTWTVGDPTLGSFSGSTFTSGVEHGGSTSIIASLGTVAGSGQLNLVFQRRYLDPGSTGLPTDPSASFGGAASTMDSIVPRLVYPDDNVLVPPNLGTLEFHFTPGGDGSAASPNTLFELSFSNVVTDIKVYLRCPAPPPYTDSAATPAKLTVAHGCVYISDPTLWSWIAETNRGGSPLAVSVRGTTDMGGMVGTSNTTHVSFSFDDIQGAMYYWEIGVDQPCVDDAPPSGRAGPGCGGSDTTAIVRYDFAGTVGGGTTFLTPASPGSTGGTCLGCHALSHDGTKLVAEAGGQSDGRSLLWDVAMEKAIVPFTQADRTLFEAWNPDGSQYVGVNNFSTDPSQDGTSGGTACVDNTTAHCDLNLRLYDGTNGKFVADVPGTSVDNLPADHPDWSPDGNSIAYTLVGKANGAVQTTLQQAYAGSLYVVTKTGSTWNAPVAVVKAPDDHTSYYYPAFSPDNALLVFDRAVCPSGHGLDPTCWFDTAPTSRLFAAPPTANAVPVELANANKPGPLDKTMDLTNSYPKWSPFIFQRTAELGSKLLWMTFASKRRFGLRAQPVVVERSSDGEILWMSAVDPNKVAGGQDGSSVAFALPFQRLYKSNHIAQWTTKFVPPIL